MTKHSLDSKFLVELTKKQFGVLMCLLSVHSRNPVMSPADTEILNGLEKLLEKQLEASAELLPFEV